MGSMHCRLYDENLVYNIILSTGLAVVDFLNEHRDADADEVCEYLELNADSLIEQTIQRLNNNSQDDDNDENCPFPNQ